MARVFITGSTDGLGLMEARMLVSQGHQVVLHGRNRKRADEALSRVPGALSAVGGDLAGIAETKSLADQVNERRPFDAVIHNAGVYLESRLIRTVDGLPQVFAVNSLAPYILTCLIRKPKRLVYTSSGLHRGGAAALDDLTWSSRPWDGSAAYADAKLHNVILAFAVARKWPDVLSNAVDPGWAATKMGGPGAPVSVEEGARTQVWLAAGRDKETPCNPCSRFTACTLYCISVPCKGYRSRTSRLLLVLRHLTPLSTPIETRQIPPRSLLFPATCTIFSVGTPTATSTVQRK